MRWDLIHEGARAQVSPGRVSAALLLAVFTLLAASPLGRYLELVGFLHPAFALRHELGLEAPLDRRLRAIVVDDKSLDKLGRHPSFADWLAIGARLADEGVRRGIFLGVPTLDDEVGALPAGPARLPIWVGAVETQGLAKSRSVTGESLESRLKLALPKPNPQPAPKPEAKAARFIAPPPALLALAAGLGTMNFGDEAAMPAAFAADSASLVPNLALRAAPGLGVGAGGRFFDASGLLPVVAGGTVAVDFRRTADILKLSVPVAAFFDDEGQVVAELSPALKAKLAGAELVVFAPEAHTGARFVSTPFGKQPSYTSLVAVVDSVLGRRFLNESVPHVAALTMLLAALFSLFLVARSRVALVVLATAFVLWLALGFVAFAFAREVLPVMQGAILIATAISCRAVVAWRDSVITTGRFAAEIETGQLVQTLMLRSPKTGTWGPWQFHIHFHPYGALSGDWFQVFTPDPDSSAEAVGEGGFAVLAIGDVVGKGASASLLTSAIASIWASHSRRWRQGEQRIEPLIRELDEMIRELFAGQQNSTLSLAVLTAEKAYLACCGAPHWQEIDVAGGASIRVPTAAMSPLGLDTEPMTAVLTERSTEVGRVLFGHTDGVLDSGRSRVSFRKKLKEADLAASSAVFASLVEVAQEVSVGEALPDDVTILMIRRVA